MKHLSLLLFACLFIYSCADTTQQEKNLLNDILKVHDKVMNHDEALMKNKMKLDTLLKQKKDTTIVKELSGKIASADDAMGSWMSKFQPDMTGKSHDEVMKYYNEQKKQVMAIDSQINLAIDESNKYFSTKKIK